jgi:hypothetical protein
VSGKTVAAGLGAAAAAAVGAAAVAGKKASTEDATEEQPRMDVGVPFEATPTYTGQAETEPVDRGDAAYGGGTPGGDVYTDRSDTTAYPPDNTLGQPTDPDRT